MSRFVFLIAFLCLSFSFSQMKAIPSLSSFIELPPNGELSSHQFTRNCERQEQPAHSFISQALLTEFDDAGVWECNSIQPTPRGKITSQGRAIYLVKDNGFLVLPISNSSFARYSNNIDSIFRRSSDTGEFSTSNWKYYGDGILVYEVSSSTVRTVETYKRDGSSKSEEFLEEKTNYTESMVIKILRPNGFLTYTIPLTSYDWINEGKPLNLSSQLKVELDLPSVTVVPLINDLTERQSEWIGTTNIEAEILPLQVHRASKVSEYDTELRIDEDCQTFSLNKSSRTNDWIEHLEQLTILLTANSCAGYAQKFLGEPFSEVEGGQELSLNLQTVYGFYRLPIEYREESLVGEGNCRANKSAEEFVTKWHPSDKDTLIFEQIERVSYSREAPYSDDCRTLKNRFEKRIIVIYLQEGVEIYEIPLAQHKWDADESISLMDQLTAKLGEGTLEVEQAVPTIDLEQEKWLGSYSIE